MKRSARRLSLMTMALATLALAGVVAGCGGSGNSEESASASKNAQAPASSTQAPAGSSQSVANVPPATIALVIKSDDEHGKKGPEGKWHDAYLPANFTVKAGQHVTVTVKNYDDMKHSFTSTGLGVNAIIPEGSETKAGEATFSFTAPSKAGEYEWWCALPCDPWSMTHKGFMRGEVTVA